MLIFCLFDILHHLVCSFLCLNYLNESQMLTSPNSLRIKKVVIEPLSWNSLFEICILEVWQSAYQFNRTYKPKTFLILESDLHRWGDQWTYFLVRLSWISGNKVFHDSWQWLDTSPLWYDCISWLIDRDFMETWHILPIIGLKRVSGHLNFLYFIEIIWEFPFLISPPSKFAQESLYK